MQVLKFICLQFVSMILIFIFGFCVLGFLSLVHTLVCKTNICFEIYSIILLAAIGSICFYLFLLVQKSEIYEKYKNW